MKLFNLFTLMFFISCNQTGNKFKNDSFQSDVVISRYVPKNIESICVIALDSIGLYYIDENFNHRNIDDENIFNLLKNIDSSRVNEFNKCLDTVKNINTNEYSYHFFFKNKKITKEFNIGEVYGTNCANGMIDSLRAIFLKLH